MFEYKCFVFLDEIKRSSIKSQLKHQILKKNNKDKNSKRVIKLFQDLIIQNLSKGDR